MSIDDDIGQLKRDAEEDAALMADHREREALVALARGLLEYEYACWSNKTSYPCNHMNVLFERFHTVVAGTDWAEMEAAARSPKISGWPDGPSRFTD